MATFRKSSMGFIIFAPFPISLTKDLFKTSVSLKGCQTMKLVSFRISMSL